VLWDVINRKHITGKMRITISDNLNFTLSSVIAKPSIKESKCSVAAISEYEKRGDCFVSFAPRSVKSGLTGLQ